MVHFEVAWPMSDEIIAYCKMLLFLILNGLIELHVGTILLFRLL